MPNWQEEIRRRLASANLDPAREAGIAQELEEHLEDHYTELLALGRSPEDARRATLDELRDDIRMRHELAGVVPPPDPLPPPGAATRAFSPREWWRDVRYAARRLRRAPAFTLIAMLTLAVGIGGTVTIASAVYTVLYRPLPLANPDRLVVPVSVNHARDILRGSVPYADYADWREERDVFEAVALFNPIQVDLAGGEIPERVAALQVSPEYFETMKGRPVTGRLLRPDDHAPDATRVVVIGDRLWTRRFGRDPAIAGTTVRIAGTVVTIAGVVSAEAMWPDEIDMWLPMRPSLLDDDVRTRRDNMIYRAVARLAEGAPIEQARARVASIAERVAREHASSRAGWTTHVIPLREYIVEPELRLGMMVLLGGVGFVLLIACVNLANLLLARGADRAREMALRSALGASRGRLIRQMMIESLVLAAAGGAAGLLLARWMLDALVGVAPEGLPMIEQLRIDGVALGVAAGVTMGTAVLIGLLPALAASGDQPVDALREGGRTSGAGRRTARVRDALVVAQIALAIVLLTGAGLMLRSFRHLLQVDPGVDVERILAGRISVPYARYQEAGLVQFYERLTDALAAVPGVDAAAATSFLPAGGRGFGLGRVFLLDGQPEPPASTDHQASWNVVTPDYFRAAGISVLRGRSFTRDDRADTVPVIMINQTMARRVFGDADPIGRRIRSWRDENLLREIVGVVSDVRYDGLADDEQALVYVPHRQNAWWGSLTVIVRARGEPAAFGETLRREVARLDPDVAVAGTATLSSMAAASIAPQRFGAMLFLLFAAAAALLAGIGVYGVMSYVVAQWRHELGVRLALGATPRGLFGLIMRRGIVLTVAGAILGVLGGLALGPLMGDLLHGVRPRDPATLASVPLLLVAVALIACAIPGRRAARIDPLEALRQ